MNGIEIVDFLLGGRVQEGDLHGVRAGLDRQADAGGLVGFDQGDPLAVDGHFDRIPSAYIRQHEAVRASCDGC